MKVLVTTPARVVFKDNNYWANTIYGISFFERYLSVFDDVYVVCRVTHDANIDVSTYLKMNSEHIHILELPMYRGPVQYFKNSITIKKKLNEYVDMCDCGIMRIPDEVAFNLVKIHLRKHKVFGVEVVSDSYDFFKKGTMKTPLRPFLRMRWHINQKKACVRADAVTYVTQKYIQKRYPTKIRNCDDRFETFYTSADIDDNYYRNPNLSKTFFKSGVINLINISGINNYAKGHKQMIDAVSMLKENGISAKITFVGDGIYRKHFEEYARSKNVYDKVVFAGHINERKVITDLLLAADIFLFPSLTEGLPRAVIEAMAVGLPCIVSDVGGNSELIEKDFLLQSLNPTEIVKNIYKFYNDHLLAKQQSIKNFNKALEYSHANVFIKRKEFYNFLKNKYLKKKHNKY